MSALRGYYDLCGDIIRASGEGIISALGRYHKCIGSGFSALRGYHKCIGGYHDLCRDITSALGWIQ